MQQLIIPVEIDARQSRKPTSAFRLGHEIPWYNIAHLQSYHKTMPLKWTYATLDVTEPDTDSNQHQFNKKSGINLSLFLGNLQMITINPSAHQLANMTQDFPKKSFGKTRTYMLLLQSIVSYMLSMR